MLSIIVLKDFGFNTVQTSKATLLSLVNRERLPSTVLQFDSALRIKETQSF